MARRATPSGPKPPTNLSPAQMKAALPKLERRIKELREFDLTQIHGFDNPEVAMLKNRIDSTLIEILAFIYLTIDGKRPIFPPGGERI